MIINVNNELRDIIRRRPRSLKKKEKKKNFQGHAFI